MLVYLLLAGAAFLGGALNSVAGGGSFLAFPALVFAGVPAVSANATTAVALWPGSLASAVAYRKELQRERLLPMAITSLFGGIAGALLLLRTSDTTFVRLVPWLLLLAATLFTFGGKLTAWVRARARVGLAAAVLLQLVISFYGGYFGGGMGIMMLAVLSLVGMSEIHPMNALKTLLATLINGVAVAAFVVAGKVAWAPGAVMVIAGTLGGWIGARVARKIPPRYVRAFIILVAWSMTIFFFVR